MKKININKLSWDELISLNRQVCARLRELEQKSRFKAMVRFNIGEAVTFDSGEGRRVSGVIIKINKKTISIMTPEKVQWNVHPSLLKKTKTHFKSASTNENVIPLR